ncbi:ABC transporter permease [Terribacillus saccharophilus]|uniref:ABC transporter permease n=1 Tax=Terribacillus saccharophilus TaxID=361277 RepID=A0A268AG93_9BACI|nr:ABC transporter permease [Terribacillus saccharophilus]PAD23136.1 hypothetical protein CHH64_00535 [Terribacillus saccharophilus]
MTFNQMIQIEFKKVKRSKILPILIIAPLLIIVSGINSLISYITPEDQGAWQAMFVQSCLLFAYYLLPLTMVVVSILIIQRENANNGILKMLSLPIIPSRMALAKFIVFLHYLLLEILIFFLFFIIAGLYASNYVGLNDPVPYGYVLKWSVLLFVTAIPLVAFIWMLACLFKKAFLSIGLSMFMVIGSVFIANTNAWILFPFSYSGKFVSEELSRISNAEASLDINLYPFIAASLGLTLLFIFVSSIRYGKKAVN